MKVKQREDAKRADCDDETLTLFYLCAQYFRGVWFGFRRLLEKEGFSTVTTQHFTHT